jgi:archaellum component FlaC
LNWHPIAKDGMAEGCGVAKTIYRLKKDLKRLDEDIDKLMSDWEDIEYEIEIRNEKRKRLLKGIQRLKKGRK